MSDAFFVRVFERVSDLRCDLPGLLEGQRPLGRFAFHQFHCQGAVFDPIDLGDVRVIQRSQDLGLALEPGHAGRIAFEGFRQNFQRDLALQFGVAGAIHLAHASGAEQGLGLVRAKAGPGREGHWGDSTAAQRQ